MTATEVIRRAESARKPPRALMLLKMLGSRVLQLIVVVLVLVVGTSLLVRVIPGDPAQAILGLSATPEALAAMRTELGLDQPVLVQVWNQIAGLTQFDFGTSLKTNRPVGSMLADAFPVSLLLMACSVAIALIVSIPLGLQPAIRRAPGFERVLGLTMVVLLAIPAFVIAIYALLLVAVTWHLAPAGGWGDGVADVIGHAWLPSIVLSLMMIPLFTRTIQRSTIDLLGEEFIDAANTHALSKGTIVFKHVMPNVLLPLITLVGYSSAVLLGGAVIIEAIFGIPGFGQVIVKGVAARDYPVIVGATLVGGIFVVAVNLITDVLYNLVDPRTRVA